MSSPTSIAEFEAAQERWRYQVGRLILAFGEIEFGVCQCLVHVPETNQWEALKNNNDFKAKANAAIVHIQKSQLPAETQRKLVNALNKAMMMANDRNLVAHNPLHLGMYMNEAGELDFRLQVFSLRKPEVVMTYEQLTAAADRATELSMELTVLAGEVA